MKLFQSLSATLILIIAFSACSNDASNNEAAVNTDSTTVSAPATINAEDANQQKLEANKKLVADFIQSLYGDKDSTAIDKYIADNIIQHDPVLQDGKEWLKHTLGFFFKKSKY